MSSPGRFLSRWSRLKQAQPDAAAGIAPAAASPAPQPPVDDRTPDTPDAAAPAAALPDTATLTLDSDFTAFLKDEVGDALRCQALKKLFTDPHFNVMDGLDIYIGDYSVSEPIPPEMLAKLRSASEWLAGREQEAAAELPAAGVEDRTAEGTQPGAAEEQTVTAQGALRPPDPVSCSDDDALAGQHCPVHDGRRSAG